MSLDSGKGGCWHGAIGLPHGPAAYFPFLFLLVCICNFFDNFESIKLAAAQKLNVMFRKKKYVWPFLLFGVKWIVQKLFNTELIFTMPVIYEEGTKVKSKEREGNDSIEEKGIARRRKEWRARMYP